MNNYIRKLFEGGKIFSDTDRGELAKMDDAAAPYTQLLDKLLPRLNGTQSRQDRLFTLAAQLVENPTDEKLAEEYRWCAALPSNPIFSLRHVEILTTAVSEKQRQLCEPQGAIVRRVFQKALARAEAELKKVETTEREEARAGGYDYSPSGRVLGLQQKVLQYRNEAAVPIPGEENYHGAPHWRQRLAEFL